MSRFHRVVGIPADDRVVAVDLDGGRHDVSLLAYEGPMLEGGDWVVVHSGFALFRADPDDAEAALAQWQSLEDRR
jgi:hydrogenase maturation factor